MTAKKPAERRQRGKRTKELGASVVQLPQVSSSGRPVPPAALSWSDDVQDAWRELWSSPLAAHFKPTDLPALTRLFEHRHALGVAMARAAEEGVVAGSMGQPTLSPWFAEAHRLEKAVAQLEDRFGLTPLSRLRLGVTCEEGVSLASRNAALIAQFGSDR